MKKEEISKLVKASDKALIELEKLSENGHPIERKKIRGYKLERWSIELVCPKCGKRYWKTLYEFNKNINKNRDNFCSVSCSSNYLTTQNRSEASIMFDFYLNAIRKRCNIEKTNKYRRSIKYDITADDLHEIWKKQDGMCAYTGVKLTLKNRRNINVCNNNFMASVDRIDSSKSYTKDNIQFISITANLAKNTMSHKEMIEFCKIVANKWK